jgi:NAD(P)H-hydrate repair Nnr-like enzyme with NAD(P)H-hydrate dehydratase domain
MTQIPHWNDPALWREKFPAPSPQDHKYTRGHAVLFGGDEMTGATQLASLSCRRTGAGLVTILCSEKAHPIYALSSPGTLTHIVTSAHDRHSFLQDKRKNAILVGPGLTPNQETKQLVCEVLTLKRPTVLDAGALKAFAANPQELFQLCTPSVLLTPHG